MGLRQHPTQRQRRLGQELQRLREPTGLSAAEAGRRIGVGRAHMSHIEAGRTHVSVEKVRALAQAYGCTRHELVEGLVAMAASDGRGWWSEYKQLLRPQLLDLAELEGSATGHRSFEFLYVPGLLQTPDYTKALFQNTDSEHSPDLQERYREFRMRRQQVLTTELALDVHAILHEGVFHMGFVDRDIMVGQLEHLIKVSQSPNVTIQILPFSATVHPTTSGHFVIFDAAAPELRTVYVEHSVTSMFLDDHGQIEQFAGHFARLSKAALAPLDTNGPYGEGTFGLVQYLLYALKEGRHVRP